MFALFLPGMGCCYNVIQHSSIMTIFMTIEHDDVDDAEFDDVIALDRIG